MKKAETSLQTNIYLNLATILAFMFSCGFLMQASWAQQSRPGITIPNLKQSSMNRGTNFDTGPCVGNILNAHFFPGFLDYLDGNYAYAMAQMDYVIDRPQYTAMNPKQAEYLSTAHYIRGSIFLDHATGIGRHELAVTDFSSSIKWNSRNYHSYLKLATSYITMNLRSEANETLQSLLALHPPESIIEEANRILHSKVEE